MLDFLRARAEKRYALVINDPRPVESVDSIWSSAAQIATIGIFILLLMTALYFCRPLLLPILSAMVIGATLAPTGQVRRQQWGCRPGSPRWC